MTKEIIGKQPNTYTATKVRHDNRRPYLTESSHHEQALGEVALLSDGGCLPISIVRPSIVTAAWREPLPGWVENLNGPTGSIAAVGKGLQRSVYCRSGVITQTGFYHYSVRRDARCDWIPVDVAINLSLVVGWKTATEPRSEYFTLSINHGDSNSSRNSS